MKGNQTIFDRRLAQHYNELKWLYGELYQDEAAFQHFCGMLERCWKARKKALWNQDIRREEDPDWYRRRNLLGMMLHVDAFAGTLEGVQKKLGYIKECGVNCLHLMPLLASPKGGKYTVSDFRAVQPELGSMDSLEALADACRKQKISLCLDFTMNYTSEEHEWAQKARAGVPGYQERYFFYDSWDLPCQFETAVPQGGSAAAPGSFTQLDSGQIVMTNSCPCRWDLNYANPAVFNDMTENLLFLANRGLDIIRLEAIPDLWKAPGSSCRGLPQVHTLMRMLRMVCEIVCPGVLLLGEAALEPEQAALYFGTPSRPECHMLCSAAAADTVWHTLATGDVALLKRQTETVCSLPKNVWFLNCLRCHDAIGWDLDYPWLKQNLAIDEMAHRRYLNNWFTGQWPGSSARGGLYDNGRLYGATASLCGMEAAGFEGGPFQLERAVSCDLTLHAWILAQSGIPVLYSGDEVGQLNGCTCHSGPDKREDSSRLHQGAFQWELAENRNDPDTCQGKLFQGLRRLEALRAGEPCFDGDASVWVEDSGDRHVLALCRRSGERELVCLFNFSPYFVRAGVNRAGSYTELMYGARYQDIHSVELWPNGFAWLLKDAPGEAVSP